MASEKAIGNVKYCISRNYGNTPLKTIIEHSMICSTSGNAHLQNSCNAYYNSLGCSDIKEKEEL